MKKIQKAGMLLAGLLMSMTAQATTLDFANFTLNYDAYLQYGTVPSKMVNFYSLGQMLTIADYGSFAELQFNSHANRYNDFSYSSPNDHAEKGVA